MTEDLDDTVLPDDEADVDEVMTEDVGDERIVRRQARRQRDLERERERFWVGIMGTPIGRQEIWGLLQSAHTFETRFAAGPTGFPDPMATMFHAGEKAWGERFYATLMKIDTAAVLLMHQEQDPRLARPKRKDSTNG